MNNKVDLSNGLTEFEVERKKKLDGLNILTQTKNKSNFFLILCQFWNYYIILLFLVSIFSFFIAHIRNESYFPSLVIFIFSFINIYLKYYQVKRTNKSVNYNDIFNNNIVVKRDGITKNVKISELVVGDLVYLESGTYSFIEGKNIDNTEEIMIGDYIIDSNNYIVTKIGNNTELCELLNNKNRNKINDSNSIIITFISLCMIILVMIIGLIFKYDFFDILVLSLSMLIAIIPEGLILCDTFHLMNGNNFYRKNNIKMNKLDDIKKLGKIDILILSDNYLNIVDSINKLGIKCIIISSKNLNTNIDRIDRNMVSSITKTELLEKIKNNLIIENVSVKEKLKIIDLFKESGLIVGIIGENINDLYAMLESNISLSLNDSNISNYSNFIFPNINLMIKGIYESQFINDKIEKSNYYLLASCIIEAIIIFFSIILNTEIFTNIQILWLNLIIETILAMLLSYDNVFYNLKNNYKFRIILKIIFHSIVAIFLFLYYSKVEDILIASSFLFVYFIINEIVSIFSFKDFKNSLLNNKIFDNKYILFGILLIISINLVVLSSKLSSYLIISGIGIKNILILIFISISMFIVGELIKPIYRKVFKD